MEIFRKVGIPKGVVNYLPRIGEVAGHALVSHTGVDLIAFTGSREVGLRINEIAAKTDIRQTNVKRVIAEMGGKNAVIIDSTADIDEAVKSIIYSAFSYSGQKCSAASRVIDLDDVYDRTLDKYMILKPKTKNEKTEDPYYNINYHNVYKKITEEKEKNLSKWEYEAEARVEKIFRNQVIFLGFEFVHVFRDDVRYEGILQPVKSGLYEKAFAGVPRPNTERVKFRDEVQGLENLFYMVSGHAG